MIAESRSPVWIKKAKRLNYFLRIVVGSALIFFCDKTCDLRTSMGPTKLAQYKVNCFVDVCGEKDAEINGGAEWRSEDRFRR